ncbi:hypothetical protein EG831_07135 [bacterium]|nr:hypothetical protein [bacterium]
MLRKTCFILFLYYAVGTCAAQGGGPRAVGVGRAPAAPQSRDVRVVVCTAAGESEWTAAKETVTPRR